VLVQRLGVVDPGQAAREEREARLTAYRAVLAFLDSEDMPQGVPTEQVAHVRTFYEKRIQLADARAEDPDSGAEAPTGDPMAAYRELKRALLTVQRQAITALHDQGQLGDESRRRLERSLDREEAQLL
jgi:hypothetical protein